MYPGNQDDHTQRMGAQNDPYGQGASQGYTQPAGQGYNQPNTQAYSQSGYNDDYRGGSYSADSGYESSPQPPRGPAVDVGKFAGSVAATALVAAIAGWLIAWVVDSLFSRFGHPWANGGNTPTMYAIYGAVAAILAGLLWYLLLIGTANPRQFFSWTVGLLTVAAVALPLLLTVPFLDGVAAAIVNLCIGLPILALTSAFANTIKR